MSQTEVTVEIKTVHRRPSGHKLSPLFSNSRKSINHKETLKCPHAVDHAMMLAKLLDVLAKKCGIDRHEFPPDHQFVSAFNQLTQQINTLHKSTSG